MGLALDALAVGEVLSRVALNTTGHKKTDVTLGVILLLAAMLLFGMAIRYAAMYDERSLLSIVLGIGGYCTLAKGWLYLVKGLGLSKGRRPSVYDPPGPPL